MLVKKRSVFENMYRSMTGDESEKTENEITNARSDPQANKQLQAIHEAHKTALLKEAEIKQAEGELAAARAELTPSQKTEDSALPKDAELPEVLSLWFQFLCDCIV